MWTPITAGDPYAQAAVLNAAIPFTPVMGNRGPLTDTPTPTGVVNLSFPAVLGDPPEACWAECIHAIWVNGEAIRAADTTAPPGWLVTDITSVAGWPGTTLEVRSPTVFLGLSVTLDFAGALVRRIVALTEWRGEPSAPSFTVTPGGGGGTG